MDDASRTVIRNVKGPVREGDIVPHLEKVVNLEAWYETILSQMASSSSNIDPKSNVDHVMGFPITDCEALHISCRQTLP